MAFGYYSPISINAAQVPSTQTDFPVLVSITDARFKTVANSGHVQNASGFDIRPYSDSGLSTAITGYELERYNATTGEVVMWVKVGSLSSSTTPIYLAYGDSGISTDGSSTTTWSNGFLGVYHLKDGTTLSVADSTGSNNGTNHSATATAGKIDGGASFASASSQFIDLGTAIHPVAITISAWVNGTTFPAAYNAVVARVPSGNDFWGLWVKSTGKLACIAQRSPTFTVSYDGTGSHTLSTGTTYYLTMVFNNALTTAALVGYVNAASDGSVNVGTQFDLQNIAATVDIASDPLTSPRFWNGMLDEVRIASSARSANWITTEYNNQSAPGTFETLGSEVAVTISATGNFFTLFP